MQLVWPVAGPSETHTLVMVNSDHSFMTMGQSTVEALPDSTSHGLLHCYSSNKEQVGW